MRLRVPIRHDERIGYIATDETLPSVIVPSLAPLEMPGDTQSPAPLTGHGTSIGGSEHVRVTAALRLPPDDPVHRNSVPASLIVKLVILTA